MLAKLHALHDAECVLENATRVHAAAIGALAEAKSLVDAAHRLETAADQAEHALKLAREKLAGRFSGEKRMKSANGAGRVRTRRRRMARTRTRRRLSL